MGWAWSSRPATANLVDWAALDAASFIRGRNAAAVMRFRHKFEAARLKHLNLVAAFEANEDRGVHFLVMDFVQGVNLDKVIAQKVRQVPQALDYLIQSAAWRPPTNRESFIAISSRETSYSTTRGPSVCSTWAWLGSSTPVILSARPPPAG